MSTTNELDPTYVEALRKNLQSRKGQYLVVAERSGVSHSFIVRFARGNDRKLSDRPGARPGARRNVLRKLAVCLLAMDSTKDRTQDSAAEQLVTYRATLKILGLPQEIADTLLATKAKELGIG